MSICVVRLLVSVALALISSDQPGISGQLVVLTVCWLQVGSAVGHAAHGAEEKAEANKTGLYTGVCAPPAGPQPCQTVLWAFSAFMCVVTHRHLVDCAPLSNCSLRKATGVSRRGRGILCHFTFLPSSTYTSSTAAADASPAEL